ncbi:unnamed protein product [Bemisia tabaci]|uniref:EF-hand domain-containing protein n=1 Tax=Bemisia tabaci TaxID=7038 RepID=A0A9P0AFS6_BEMTA|nr:unnamed protein product [Bemisia tabaci]
MTLVVRRAARYPELKLMWSYDHTKLAEEACKELAEIHHVLGSCTVFVWKYTQDCPNGRLTPAKFVDMYKMFFPSGNAEEFCDHVFRTFDMDKNGYIDFKKHARREEKNGSKFPHLPARSSQIEARSIDRTAPVASSERLHCRGPVTQSPASGSVDSALAKPIPPSPYLSREAPIRNPTIAYPQEPRYRGVLTGARSHPEIEFEPRPSYVMEDNGCSP